MARHKVKIKRIENTKRKNACFAKRREGIVKKAHDLSVLCDADIGVLIFSSKGKLFQFASSSMQEILNKQTCYHGESQQASPSLEEAEEQEAIRLRKSIENIELRQRHLQGEQLGNLSWRELVVLEKQIYLALASIHAKQVELLFEQIEYTNKKVEGILQMVNTNPILIPELQKDPQSQTAPSNTFTGDICEEQQRTASKHFWHRNDSGNKISKSATSARLNMLQDLNEAPADP